MGEEAEKGVLVRLDKRGRPAPILRQLVICWPFLKRRERYSELDAILGYS